LAFFFRWRPRVRRRHARRSHSVLAVNPHGFAFFTDAELHERAELRKREAPRQQADLAERRIFRAEQIRRDVPIVVPTDGGQLDALPKCGAVLPPYAVSRRWWVVKHRNVLQSPIT
jgi:hypothetical protein